MPALIFMWWWLGPLTWWGIDVRRMQARATLRIVREGDEDGYGSDR